MAITYHDLYLNTRMALTGAGIEAAQLEARELICAAAGKTAEELYRDISLYTTDEIAVQTEALLARRLAGEPIAYLIGEWSFCGLPFYVMPRQPVPAHRSKIRVWPGFSFRRFMASWASISVSTRGIKTSGLT